MPPPFPARREPLAGPHARTVGLRPTPHTPPSAVAPFWGPTNVGSAYIHDTRGAAGQDVHDPTGAHALTALTTPSHLGNLQLPPTAVSCVGLARSVFRAPLGWHAADDGYQHPCVGAGCSSSLSVGGAATPHGELAGFAPLQHEGGSTSHRLGGGVGVCRTRTPLVCTCSCCLLAFARSVCDRGGSQPQPGQPTSQARQLQQQWPEPLSWGEWQAGSSGSAFFSNDTGGCRWLVGRWGRGQVGDRGCRPCQGHTRSS